MEKIYSKVEPEKLLHIISRVDDITVVREDVVPPTEFIQMANLNLSKGKTFKPHKHFFKPGPESVIAQESWVVIRGSVKCFFYDIDDTLLAEKIINVGDCSITIAGGHNYEALEDDTRVREYKTGPYSGVENDKTFING